MSAAPIAATKSAVSTTSAAAAAVTAVDLKDHKSANVPSKTVPSKPAAIRTKGGISILFLTKDIPTEDDFMAWMSEEKEMAREIKYIKQMYDRDGLLPRCLMVVTGKFLKWWRDLVNKKENEGLKIRKYIVPDSQLPTEDENSKSIMLSLVNVKYHATDFCRKSLNKAVTRLLQPIYDALIIEPSQVAIRFPKREKDGDISRLFINFKFDEESDLDFFTKASIRCVLRSMSWPLLYDDAQWPNAKSLESGEDRVRAYWAKNPEALRRQ
jgi:hypothetical protein